MKRNVYNTPTTEAPRPRKNAWEAVNEAGEVIATAPEEEILRKTFGDDFEIRRRAGR